MKMKAPVRSNRPQIIYRTTWRPHSMNTLPTRFCVAQVDDLQEEGHKARQHAGERGTEGGHQLLPADDRQQRSHVGQLRTDVVSAAGGGYCCSRCLSPTAMRRGHQCPRVVFETQQGAETYWREDESSCFKETQQEETLICLQCLICNLFCPCFVKVRK